MALTKPYGVRSRKIKLKPGQLCPKCGTGLAGSGYPLNRTPSGEWAHSVCPGAEKNLGRNKIARFDSCASFADACEDIHAESTGSKWTGRPWGECVRMARGGDTSLVAEASALIDRLRFDAPETVRAQWLPSIGGAYPVVGDFLTGRPDSMRRRQQVREDRAPLRVVVDLTTSGGLGADAIAKRGVAVLALAMLLSEQRPLDLFVFTPLNNYGGVAGPLVRIPAQPLELATACHAMTSEDFARSLGYDCVRFALDVPVQGNNWAFGISPFDGGLPRYVARVREALELAPDDLYIPPAFLTDKIINDPAAWLAEKLAALGPVNEEA